MPFFRGVFRKHNFRTKSKSDSSLKSVNNAPNIKILKYENNESVRLEDIQEKPGTSNSEESKGPKLDDNSACTIIKDEIKSLSEEVCTIISLIPLLSTIEEGREMDQKIKLLDSKIQSLLAPLHYYMTAPAPESANQNLWDLDRQHVNRQFESTVENFRAAQKTMRLELVKLNSKKRF